VNKGFGNELGGGGQTLAIEAKIATQYEIKNDENGEQNDIDEKDRLDFIMSKDGGDLVEELCFTVNKILTEDNDNKLDK